MTIGAACAPEKIMNRIDFSRLIATLLFVYGASAQTSRAGDGVGAAQVDAIYPDIERLYIDLHRNPELAFHEQRTAATLTARVKALGDRKSTRLNSSHSQISYAVFCLKKKKKK